MKIINRYVLKEHLGPFVFALSALTSLLLLQYIARKFGDLVGRGLSWGVISEFLLLSLPFTLAETLPMAMLVSVLYAFTRLASENEITAFKAGGVSTRSLLIPSIAAATVLALFMVWFNDQVLSRANHELQTLQTAIAQTKPTFALRPQVINTVKESQLYLRAGQIDETTGLMRDVTIYDVSDGGRRRTIYSDSGLLTMMPNHRDLSLRLYKGWMLSTPTSGHGQLSRIYYRESVRKVADVAKSFQSISADTMAKGDREMTVCEMQKQLDIANASVRRALTDSEMIVLREKQPNGANLPVGDTAVKPPRGIGALYCGAIKKYLSVAQLHAETLPQQTTGKPAAAQPAATPPQQAAPRHPDSLFVLVDGKQLHVAYNKIPPDAYLPNGAPIGEHAKAVANQMAVNAAAAAAVAARGTPPPVPPGTSGRGAPLSVNVNPATSTNGTVAGAPSTGTTPNITGLTEAHLRLEEARLRRNRADIEIQKKFSLAFACIVFVLVGAPLALRFPRGGVGLVIGATFFIIATYYVGLTAGESLANKNIISPFWSMWADNIVFLVAGLLLVSRMGNEGVTGRGGSGIAEWIDGTRAWFARRRGGAAAGQTA